MLKLRLLGIRLILRRPEKPISNDTHCFYGFCSQTMARLLNAMCPASNLPKNPLQAPVSMPEARWKQFCVTTYCGNLWNWDSFKSVGALPLTLPMHWASWWQPRPWLPQSSKEINLILQWFSNRGPTQSVLVVYLWIPWVRLRIRDILNSKCISNNSNWYAPSSHA